MTQSTTNLLFCKFFLLVKREIKFLMLQITLSEQERDDLKRKGSAIEFFFVCFFLSSR